MAARNAWGVGLATVGPRKTILDTWYPHPRLGNQQVDEHTESMFARVMQAEHKRGDRAKVIRLAVELDSPPASTEDAYLRLHLLSKRLVLPNTINLDGIFDVLPNVVWTSLGPFAPEDFDETRMRLRLETGRHLRVESVDKFPRMLNYVVPERVRVASAARVRLGAYLAPGTTVMHEGFVNFNAGTLGRSMVEGRISQGVVIGDGSDVGGGASIMGTLSGGGTERITIGKRCLLGANSGVGISLGDDCIVEAGLYLTAGSKINVIGRDPRVTKARYLSGQDGWLFRRNSLSGAIEAVPTGSRLVELNPSLHV